MFRKLWDWIWNAVASVLAVVFGMLIFLVFMAIVVLGYLFLWMLPVVIIAGILVFLAVGVVVGMYEVLAKKK